MPVINGKPKPEGDAVLGGLWFTRSSRKNSEPIEWRREVGLFERVADNEKKCDCCYGVIEKGTVYALSAASLERYCTRCYGWLTEADIVERSPERTFPPAETSPLLANNAGGKYGLTNGREIRHAVHVNSMPESRVK